MRSLYLLALVAAGAVIGAGPALASTPRSTPLAEPAAGLAPRPLAVGTLALAPADASPNAKPDTAPRRRASSSRESSSRASSRSESSSRSSSRESSRGSSRSSSRASSRSESSSRSSGKTASREGRSSESSRASSRSESSSRSRTASRESSRESSRASSRSESSSRGSRTASRESGRGESSSRGGGKTASRESSRESSRTSGRRESSSSSRESTAEAVLRTSRAVLSAAGIEHGASGLRVQRALTRLGGRVRTSDRDALRMAFRAYYNYKAAHPEHVRKPYLYFVDYGLDAETPRGYVFDMSELRIVEGPFPVAHGRGSAARGGVPRRFSNRHGSSATSLGLFVAQETYRFSGHANGRLYNSVGLRLRGVSGRFNADARDRGVVVHGAPYVTPDGAGRSQGCPAVSPSRARTLIPRIRNGGLVFLYSPHDRTWKNNDPWANRGRNKG